MMRRGMTVLLALGLLLGLVAGPPASAEEAYEVRQEREAHANWFDFESDVNGHVTARVVEQVGGTQDDRGPNQSSRMEVCASIDDFSTGGFDSGCGELEVTVDPLLNQATAKGTIDSHCFDCDGSFSSTPSTITVDVTWQGNGPHRLRTNPDGTFVEAEPQRESAQVHAELRLLLARDAVATGTLESAELGNAAQGPSSSAELGHRVRTCADLATGDRFAFCDTFFGP